MTETRDLHLWPIAVVQDRYGGTYSRGLWLAISEADTPEDGRRSRADAILNDGPHGDDGGAMLFWSSPPSWIAVGNSPDQAVAALRAKHTPALETSHDQ